MYINEVKKIPELLAPAGGMVQLRAAVENGADAVYMGGKLFNARMNAENFQGDELAEALEYCHVRGVKLYVTLNTLINDGQLPQLLDYAVELYQMGVDAFIIQDLGVARMIREIMPNIKLHLSTQGTVYNKEGVKCAADLGFNRVVLARENSMKEIKEMVEVGCAEIEVFVHGALCICYSGQCEMSFEIGGRSGNLGNCGQPCRLPYEIYSEENGVKTQIEKAGFVISPKDLASIKILDKLIEAGVSSLKMEGRMKSPEYVATITRVYRKYLDAYRDGDPYQVSDQDYKELLQIFNRGGFTEGYLQENPGDGIIEKSISKHQGIPLGSVAYSGTGNGLVIVKLMESLSIGDVVEIRNQYLPGNIVTYLQKGKVKIKSAKAGETITLGDIKGKVAKGDIVFKIVDANLIKNARTTFEGKNWAEKKELKKIGLSGFLNATENEGLKLTLIDEENNRVQVKSEGFTKIPKVLDKEKMKMQLCKTGGTPFEITCAEIYSDDTLSFPISVVNKMRREALAELETVRGKTGKGKTPFISVSDAVDKMLKNQWTEGKVQVLKSAYIFEEKKFLEYINLGEFSEIKLLYIPFHCFLKHIKLCAEKKDEISIIPFTGNATKGQTDIFIRENFDLLVEQIKTATAGHAISVGNLGWIEPFSSAGLNVHGDYGLNLYNSADFCLAREKGLSSGVISHELTAEKICNLNFHGVTPEIYNSGRVPVMITENSIINLSEKERQNKSFFLRDRMGEYYPISWMDQGGEKSDKTVIFNFKEKKDEKWNNFHLKTSKIILRAYI